MSLSLWMIFLSVLPAPVLPTASARALGACPAGATIDRLEGDRAVLVVHGSRGVRSIAVSSLSGAVVREGMRLRLAADGRCLVAAPRPSLQNRVRARLRDLAR
jgi:hypothetical protein